jgi:membrane protein
MSKVWNRKELTKMLYHSFIGTLADNAIEIGWILCFSLLANKKLVEDITVLFGVNDAFWVVLSLTYYTAKTSLSAILPKLIAEKGEQVESKIVKNHIYIFYIILLPLAILSWIFLPELLKMLGVQESEFSLYIPYFKLSIISLIFFAPWSVFIPSYLRARGKTKEGAILDHLNAWTMLVGIFITTHIFNLGVNTALIVNMLANGIPLYWFLWKKPIPNFFKTGFEFSFTEIRRAWSLMKWEFLRKLAPRLATILGITIMVNLNPIYVGIKYWILNMFMFVDGWISALSDLLNSHISRNIGLKEKDPNKDNEFLFRKVVLGIVINVFVIYLISKYILFFLPDEIYKGLINIYIYIFATIEFITKCRCYMWFSVSRTYSQNINGIVQTVFLIPSIFLNPILLWLFLYKTNIGLSSIFLAPAIVGSIQFIIIEFFFKEKLLKS